MPYWLHILQERGNGLFAHSLNPLDIPIRGLIAEQLVNHYLISF